MRDNIRASYRLLRVLCHIVWGWCLMRRRYPFLAPPERQACAKQWSGTLLKILAFDLRVSGDAPAIRPLVIVANHISWLDAVVLQAVLPCRFVSKSEVKSWPLVGGVATGLNTVFLPRGAHSAVRHVVAQMQEGLMQGDVFTIFPEGTTSIGAVVLPFHSNLLEAALQTQTPALPVAINYLDRRRLSRSQAPSYVDDDSFITSLWRMLLSPPLLISVELGEVQGSKGRNRRAWSSNLQSVISTLHAQGLHG